MKYFTLYVIVELKTIFFQTESRVLPPLTGFNVDLSFTRTFSINTYKFVGA